MPVQRTFTGAPWESRYGYCRALRVGDQIMVTGTAPLNEDGSTHAPGDASAQTTRCLEIIERALTDLGAAKRHIVRTRIFTTDITRQDDIGLAHKAFMGDHVPCITMIGISALVDPEMLVEIEIDAIAAE